MQSLPPIKRLKPVAEGLFRSGQPSVKELESLKDAGIRTVISFRWSMSAIHQERAVLSKSGINFINIPLTYMVLPTRKQIAKFFSIVDDPVMRPVLMHCQHGADRTGLFAAMYRMARQNWTADQAYKEMVALGFHRLRMHHFKLAVYLFERRLARQARNQVE